MNEWFGSDEWQQTFYRLNPQDSLFESGQQFEKIADYSDILTYYLDRLKTVFPHVAENPLKLYNTRNNPLYALCFAAGNPKGGATAVKIARHILGK